MARVNKQKARFERLCAEAKMAAESRALFEALLMQLEVLIGVLMQRRTVKDNSNSSLPSSQSPKDDNTATRPGAKGKGKTHNEVCAGNRRTVETVEVAQVSAWETCGEDLSETPCQGHERRTRIDILFEKVVSHVDAEIKQCSHCQAQTQGHLPADTPGPLQYGPGIKAYVLNLLIAQMLSLKWVQQSIRTLIGRVIGEASILKYVMQWHQGRAPWEPSAIEQLLAMPAVSVDETSLRVDKTNYGIPVCSAGEITLKFVHPKRAREAIEAIGVIPRYDRVVIHDCWVSSLAYDHCGHGLCGSHRLRELTFFVDARGHAWAANMKRLLQETCRRVAKRKRKRLTQGEYKKQSDAHNLWERLKKHEEAPLLFAKLPDVALPNNRAERDLRMSKVKQKVCGCFRVRKYAETYCRICSYLQTLANQGYNPLVAIQLALSGQLYADKG